MPPRSFLCWLCLNIAEFRFVGAFAPTFQWGRRYATLQLSPAEDADSLTIESLQQALQFFSKEFTNYHTSDHGGSSEGQNDSDEDPRGLTVKQLAREVTTPPSKPKIMFDYFI